MPVPAQPRVNRHTGNGVTDTYAYEFRILNEADIGVEVSGVTLTLHTDYEVTGVGNANGGNIEFTTPPVSLAPITLYSNAVYARIRFDYVRNGSFKEETVDADFDQLTILIQQLDERFGRGLYIPITDAVGTDVELPPETERAGMVLTFDEYGNVIVLAPSDIDLNLVSPYIATLLDDPDAAAARTTLGAVAKSGDTMTGPLALFGGDTIAADPPASNSSTRLPSTKWIWNNIQTLVTSCIAAVATAAGFTASFASSGYITFPSWLGSWIVQWGNVTTGAGGTFTFTFPIAFPTGKLSEAIGLMSGNYVIQASGGSNTTRSGTALVASTGAAAGSGIAFQIIVFGK